MNGPLFIANLAATVLFLALAVRAGLRRRRQLHYFLVSMTLGLLFLAIWQAELYGRKFEFDPTRLRVHLGLATATLLLLPGVGLSGWGLARGSVRRTTHRRWVTGFLGMLIVTIAAAIWMFLSAERLVPAE